MSAVQEASCTLSFILPIVTLMENLGTPASLCHLVIDHSHPHLWCKDGGFPAPVSCSPSLPIHGLSEAPRQVRNRMSYQTTDLKGWTLSCHESPPARVHWCNHVTDKTQLRQKGLLWPPVFQRRHSGWGLRTGRIASEVRKQRETNAGAQLILFSIFSPGSQPIEWCHPHPRWVFSLQLNISRNNFIDTL